MRAKLAYIVSVGHSGSTLLDMLIGTIPGCFSTGEINHLRWQLARKILGDSDDSPQTRCSCGQPFDACEVWREILDQVSSRLGFDIFSEPLRLRMNLLQNENYSGKRFSIERIHRGIYSLACTNKALAPIISVYQRILGDVVRNNWLIFDAAARITNSQFIVDSSKNAIRLSLLHDTRPGDTLVIVLMRDIRGVSYSQQKRGADPYATAKGWVDQYNRIYSILNRSSGLKILGIRYEELAGEPEKMRRRIASFLGIGDIADGYSIDTRNLHLTAGNQIRYSGQIRIRPDLDWQDGLSRNARARIEKIRENLNPKWDRYF